MFSKDFMRYLINYQPDNCKVEKKDTQRKIEFKDSKGGRLAEVYLSVK